MVLGSGYAQVKVYGHRTTVQHRGQVRDDLQEMSVDCFVGYVPVQEHRLVIDDLQEQLTFPCVDMAPGQEGILDVIWVAHGYWLLVRLWTKRISKGRAWVLVVGYTLSVKGQHCRVDPTKPRDDGKEQDK